MKKLHYRPVRPPRPRGKNPKPLWNFQKRHPKRVPIRHNRVDLVMETEIGDIDVSFGFPSASHAKQFLELAIESYAVRSATLIQHGRSTGGGGRRGS